jgi:predicted nuclease of predicted toxin-antitoxin system
MKFLIDMNLAPRWAGWLSEAGFEAVHWSQIGAADAPDHEIMARAVRHDCVAFTHDLDFGTILAATGGGKPSAVQICGADIRPEAVGEILLRALQQMALELEQGALLTIDAKRARLRVLPLR